jgi:hypothetical protein
MARWQEGRSGGQFEGLEEIARKMLRFVFEDMHIQSSNTKVSLVMNSS